MKHYSKNYFSYGIFQGRLTVSLELQKFPQDNWKEKFDLAKELNFNFI